MPRLAWVLSLLLAAGSAIAAAPVLPGSQNAPGRLDASLAYETRAALDRGTAWLARQPDLPAPALLVLAASPDPAYGAVRSNLAAQVARGIPAASPAILDWSALALTRESAGRPELKPVLADVRTRLATLPLPEDPQLLALRLTALWSLPDPMIPPDTTQRLARVAIDSDAAAAAVLLGLQATGAARNNPAIWKAFRWMESHPAMFTPKVLAERSYEDLLVLTLALAQSGENRIPLPDHSLLAWRPVIARTLVNRQRVDPASGGLYWAPSEGEPPVVSTSFALLVLQLVLAE